MKSCKVYRSDNKPETYLFLADETEFDELPETLREHFGEPAFVMRLELTADVKLARADSQSVLENLEEHGFYLQLPPKLPVEEEISRKLN